MVGCSEIIEYILYTADTCLTLGALVVRVTEMDSKYEPLVWLAFYVSAVSVYCIGGKVFWRVSKTLAFLSITILLIFCFGSFKFVDFKFAEYVGYSMDKDGIKSPLLVSGVACDEMTLVNTYYLRRSWFLGGVTEFMRVLPIAGWFYVGIESLNFAAKDISNVSYIFQ